MCFFLKLVFWDKCIFTYRCNNNFKKFNDSLNSNLLKNCVTISQPRYWHWYSQDMEHFQPCKVPLCCLCVMFIVTTPVCFLLLWKIPEVNSLWKKKVYFGSFKGFSPWLLGPVAVGLMIRQYIVLGAHGRGSCSPHMGQKEKNESQYPLQDTPW
jgi:hypothetical protein